MNFNELCRIYHLGALRSVSPVRPGTVSRVWRLDTEEGAFLVRTLTGREQGEREWGISRHLLSRGFSRIPAILTVPDGQPMAEQGGVWYQVQEFLSGERPDPGKPGVAEAIARAVKGLSEALADCPARKAADPFDLGEAWERGRDFWPLLETPFSVEQAAGEIARCRAVPRGECRVIHGDLGPWNMLEGKDGTVFLIDFGAARVGDPYFDYASALGGCINHTPPSRRCDVCREFLKELDCERQRLMEQLRLWVWQGLAQWAALAGQGTPAAAMAGKFCNALNWAEEHLYEL